LERFAFEDVLGFGLLGFGAIRRCAMSELKLLDSKAAFIDVGSEKMYVSIGGGPARTFGTLTFELVALREWLLSQSVRSVAMEATGVYWMPIYSLLEAAKLEVRMVDGRQVKNLPGRKTDVQDCQWGATLHAHGLLRAGFVPDATVRRIQDYMRLRSDHITMAASHVQKMHQAMERMNIKLHDEIASMTGASGLAIVRAILAGERDPEKLLALCHSSIQRAKADRIKESLRGTWQDEHVFALRQAYACWTHYQEMMDECDLALTELLPKPKADPPGTKGTAQKSNAGVNCPDIPGLNRILVQLCGCDPTVLPGLSEYSVLQLISEVGTDLSAWPSENHFASWTGLAKGSAQSGKRKRPGKRKRNRVGRLFGVMARSLARSKHIALGAYYRRMKSRRGPQIANMALAHKLACLFWRVMVKGLDYVEQGIAAYNERYVATQQKTLERIAKQLNCQVVPMQINQ
jgi:transposase